MKKITVAILGFGQRGYVYAEIIGRYKEEVELVAVCEINPLKKDLIKSMFQIKEENYFSNYHDFFNQGKIADILIISNQDRDHYEPTMIGLELGYDILLEKPISPIKEEILGIQAKANKLKRKVTVCHVLRYTPFYQKLKEIIDSGVIGDLVTLTQTEHVGYFHQAHSFVRGNWRKESNSAPMILAKSCHDLDIIRFLIGKKCTGISSFGNLYHFKKENAPKDSADYCYKCKVDCPYNALNFYMKNPKWMQIFTFNPNPEEVLRDETLSYAKCVYQSDNDVVDHQVVNMLFSDGATANFTMTAFSNEMHRSINLHGTKAEIVGDLENKKITIKTYGKAIEVIDVSKLSDDFTYHAGGDSKMLLDLVRSIRDNKPTAGLNDINNAVESHLMALAAEESRKQKGKLIELK